MKINNKHIGCFSDIHLGLNQDNKEWHNIALDFAKWASETYKKFGINEIIIPGDIFHNRSFISVETLSVTKKFFDYFKDFTIYISTGNHDSFLKESSSINSISILDGWDNIHIIDNDPMVLETNYSKTIGLIPWGTSLDKMPKTDIMFGHFEINSFYMNSYKICEHGFSYNDLFERSPIIISGHFHKKDNRSYKNGNITYLGSPYQQNFGDTLDERGIYILDLEKDDFVFFKNEISPKYFKLKIGEDVSENIIKNNFISLIVDNNLDEEKIIEYKGKLSALSPKIIRVDYNEKETKIDVLEENKELGTNNLMQSIEEYVETLKPENKKEVVEYIRMMYNSLI
jgi:DNA repair exonuclease SbcCD nuclease subunit